MSNRLVINRDTISFSDSMAGFSCLSGRVNTPHRAVSTKGIGIHYCMIIDVSGGC